MRISSNTYTFFINSFDLHYNPVKVIALLFYFNSVDSLFYFNFVKHLLSVHYSLSCSRSNIYSSKRDISLMDFGYITFILTSTSQTINYILFQMKINPILLQKL